MRSDFECNQTFDAGRFSFTAGTVSGKGRNSLNGKTSPYLVPGEKPIRVIIVYKNFAAHMGVSHLGLGVTALTNSKVLRKLGYWVDVWPLVGKTNASAADELNERLKGARSQAVDRGQFPPTHVVISAPWIPTEKLRWLVEYNPDIQFVVVSHSNVGFLQADTNGVRLLREAGDLQDGHANFHIGCNSAKFQRWWMRTFEQAIVLLPNLYDAAGDINPKAYTGGTLRIASLGAARPLKGHMTAAAGAMEIATRLGADLEFYMNSGRAEGGGNVVVNAIKEMFVNLPGMQLKFIPWSDWPTFKRWVGHMHLLIQMSTSESFNNVTADGISKGVPPVVSSAIDWVPERWQAEIDDADDVASAGIALLKDPQASRYGFKALQDHNRRGSHNWMDYLEPGSVGGVAVQQFMLG